MIRHYVMFAFGIDVSEEARKGAVEAMRNFLATQSYSITWSVSRDEGLVPGNASVVVVVDFEDTQRFLAFQASERHQDVLHRIAPLVASRAAVQVRHS